MPFDLLGPPSVIAVLHGWRVEPEFADVGRRITAPERMAVDLLYSDHQGNQRVISRFVLRPREDGTWLATVARHWNVDRPDPR